MTYSYNAESSRNPHLPPVDIDVLLDQQDYQAPPRPRTPVHTIVRSVLDWLPAKRIVWNDLEHFRRNTLHTLGSVGVSADLLVRAQESARWVLADRPSPQEVGSVEAKFNREETPLAIVYGDSPATRFPRPITEVFLQGGVDHLMGHLVLSVAGLDREDEDNACLLQYMAALERAKQGSNLFGLYALAMIPGYKLHKHIPSSSFNQEAQQRLMGEIS